MTTLEEVFLAVSAAACEEAKAKRQEADKLLPSDKPLHGSSLAAEHTADEELVDPKAGAELASDEQSPAEKPYTLIKVTSASNAPPVLPIMMTCLLTAPAMRRRSAWRGVSIPRV